jgi:hypothetical protein
MGMNAPKSTVGLAVTPVSLLIVAPLVAEPGVTVTGWLTNLTPLCEPLSALSTPLAGLGAGS